MATRRGFADAIRGQTATGRQVSAGSRWCSEPRELGGTPLGSTRRTADGEDRDLRRFVTDFTSRIHLERSARQPGVLNGTTPPARGSSRASTPARPPGRQGRGDVRRRRRSGPWTGEAAPQPVSPGADRFVTWVHGGPGTTGPPGGGAAARPHHLTSRLAPRSHQPGGRGGDLRRSRSWKLLFLPPGLIGVGRTVSHNSLHVAGAR